MLIKQISVFLENKSGRLAEVTKTLGDNGIDINALSIADTTDFGILRLIVNDPEKTEGILKENGFMVSCTDVIAIAVSDKPGGLSKALNVLSEGEVGIEYMYAFIEKAGDKALVLLKVEDPEKAIKALESSGIVVLPSVDIYKL